jgi:hypothetical protein
MDQILSWIYQYDDDFELNTGYQKSSGLSLAIISPDPLNNYDSLVTRLRTWENRVSFLDNI